MNPVQEIKGKKLRPPRVYLSEEDVEEAKIILKRNGPAFYEEILRFLSHPLAARRARLVAGTRFVEFSREFLAALQPLAFIAAFFLLTKAFDLANPLSWVVLLVLVWPFFKGKTEKEINYEIFARLICLDEKIRRGELEAPELPFVKTSPFSEN
ncbi:MAG: hypothetical protein L0196_07670 [candidate division Zixibacteria bacterium]|nr:hypothetical protein [candidate division Zixibacteria bacterium]